MYKAKKSFATKDYNVHGKQKLSEDFTNQEEIDEFLDIEYIETYDGSLEITENGSYDVTEYETAEVNVSGGGDISDYFYDTLNTNTGQNSPFFKYTIKKVPPITLESTVTTIQQAFYQTKIVEIEKMSNSGTTLSNIGGMCSQCQSLTKVDLSGLNTSGITDFSDLFYNCSNLTNVNISNFSGASATTTSSMFYGCRSLTELDLSNFDTPNLTNITQMFRECYNLEKLDIRKMIFDNVTSQMMAFDMPNNCEIIVKDNTQKEWITSRFSNYTNVKTVAEL